MKRSNSNSPQHIFYPSPTTYLTRQRTASYPGGMSFSSATVSCDKDQAYLEKRSAHNALERQRREGLNSKFQELAHVLPALQKIKRPSKSTIVAKSLEFVSSAAQREVNFQEQISALREENRRLQSQAKGTSKRLDSRRKRKPSRTPERSHVAKKQKQLERRSSSVTQPPVDSISLQTPLENSSIRPFEHHGSYQDLLESFSLDIHPQGSSFGDFLWEFEPL
ncbi:hypothetical protein BY458DRAFT_554937 [Sporodiniella umbellata]|nr:hypothetical protein BY458DRAFT_554937 [Sporodiniella umbellata]